MAIELARRSHCRSKTATQRLAPKARPELTSGLYKSWTALSSTSMCSTHITYTFIIRSWIFNYQTCYNLDLQNQWSAVFCGIVSRAMTLEILSTGVAGNYNGALQVVLNKIKHSLISYLILQISTFISYVSPLQMTAEFQVPSPLVPTRENYFVRYCKQHVDGTWAVVDVSLDSLFLTLPFPGFGAGYDGGNVSF